MESSDVLNCPALAVALENNEMSEIKTISCQGYPVDDDDVDLVKFSVTVVKRVCKNQKIAYRPHEKAEFEDWLAGV